MLQQVKFYFDNSPKVKSIVESYFQSAHIKFEIVTPATCLVYLVELDPIEIKMVHERFYPLCTDYEYGGYTILTENS